ncbi:MAG: hypothetical protein EAZ24_13095, partial [Burkholderiales bacterium]
MSLFNALRRRVFFRHCAHWARQAVAILASVLAASYGFAAANTDPERASGVIVRFNTEATSKRPELADAMRRASTLSRAAAASPSPALELRFARQLANQAELYRFEGPVSLNEARDVAARIALLPGVLYAAPNRVMRNQDVPVDAEYPLQWGYRLSATEQGGNFEAAWDITKGSPSQTIGVVDSGVAKRHPELAGQLRRSPQFPNGGYDFFQLASATPPL